MSISLAEILEALTMNLLEEILASMDQEASKEAAPVPARCGPELHRCTAWRKCLPANEPWPCPHPPQQAGAGRCLE